ncbi:MAG TPA: alpha/beta hydrolase [Steroidobacteraceae bacterium]|nr:alpha/beta hydrolase [Steroidobacteraceae bacterium]
MRRVLIFIAALLPLAASAATTIERNVVYGMYSGLGLLLDVHRPEKPNGFGVVFISGSGWQSGLQYGAPPLKEQQIDTWGPPLLAAGYTVFAINHRAAPRFHYPAAIDDVQRAIRFVRFHAREYGIDATRLGGVGGSSGGHLLGLAAMLGSAGDPQDADPVNRESAALTAVVLRAPLLDLARIDTVEGTAYVVSFMEAPPSNASAAAAYAAASPITHVSARSPPVLLLHGDADTLVPIAQSEAMKAALEAANVPVKLVRIPGGVHGADFGAAQRRADWPDYFGETVAWLDRYLRGK